jgi:23S rRNA (cytosine1962-C5)-methyltransferase
MPAMKALADALAALSAPPTEASRLFHGRGGLHPGLEHLTLDAYPPAYLLTAFERALTDAEQAELLALLQAHQARVAPGQPLTLLLQQRALGAGQPAQTTLLAGALPEPHVVPHVVQEDGARYQVHLLRGQNHGLFLDMAAGRAWLRAACAARAAAGQPPRVLNLFAYSCAFSVAALRGGAAQVLNLDMASGALALGRINHQLNDLPKGAAQFLAHDLFKSWGKLLRSGPFDVVVADPPSHQPGSFTAQKDWPRLLRRLPELLAPGAEALLCLNSPKFSPDWLQQQVAEQAPGLRFVQRLANPPAFADADPARALKVLVYSAPS